VPAPVRRTLAFAAHVDRGRILAHQGALEASAEDLERASAQVPAAEGEDGAYFRARLALLKGALRVAAGDEKGAREHLEGHVLRVSGQEGSRWQELGRDARLELERLPPKEGP